MSVAFTQEANTCLMVITVPFTAAWSKFHLHSATSFSACQLARTNNVGWAHWLPLPFHRVHLLVARSPLNLAVCYAAEDVFSEGSPVGWFSPGFPSIHMAPERDLLRIHHYHTPFKHRHIQLAYSSPLLVWEQYQCSHCPLSEGWQEGEGGREIASHSAKHLSPPCSESALWYRPCLHGLTDLWSQLLWGTNPLWAQ